MQTNEKTETIASTKDTGSTKASKGAVILIALYNEKALGARCLATALERAGYEANIVLFKGFHSQAPKPASEIELNNLKELIQTIQPLMVGVSCMSSLYLESADAISAMIKQNFPDLPLFWGGVFATLKPQIALQRCDFVARGEGDQVVVEIADAIHAGKPVYDIHNLAYYSADGTYVENELYPYIEDLDTLGIPKIGGDNFYFIHEEKVGRGDPTLSSFTYETCCSRGCPFACSYCSAANLKQVYHGKGKPIRFRSVASVMEELNLVKKMMPNLSMIHFWDEVFSEEPGWVEEFSKRYKSEIGLPFVIWGHPLKVNETAIGLLVDAGLHQISVGIQSGSPSVRKEIFRRAEKDEQIIEASRILSRCKVPRVVYDLMICHPLETLEQLKETFWFCTKLEHPFRLNIHGLAFLPGTDIVQTAILRGVYTEEELNTQMYAPMQEQFDRYWGGSAESFLADKEKNVWSDLIYLTQFDETLDKAISLAAHADDPKYVHKIAKLKHRMEKKYQVQNFMRKVFLVLNHKFSRKAGA